LLKRGALLLTALPLQRAAAEDKAKVPTTDEWLRRAVGAAPLSMRFTGSTARECRKWQLAFRARLCSLLGPHAPPAKWKQHLRSAKDFDDHRREELLLEAAGHPPLPLYLLVPRPAGKARAGILALHGHGRYGHHPVAGRDDLPGVKEAIKGANYDYGRQLVRRGYVVAAPCLTPFGDRLGKREAYGKQDPCSDTFLRLQMLGRLLIAENLRDGLWALEVLSRRAEVDGKRLACVGLSYGGRMAMLTAALAPAIRAAVVSGALNLMQERVGKPYSCGAQIIPGLLAYGDVPEVASLIAPRPCLWEVGSRDTLISPKWAEAGLARMRLAYKALGAEDRLRTDRFEGGHAWHGKVAYGFLDRFLK
jgi:dienelactone hydrolase